MPSKKRVYIYIYAHTEIYVYVLTHIFYLCRLCKCVYIEIDRERERDLGFPIPVGKWKGQETCEEGIVVWYPAFWNTILWNRYPAKQGTLQKRNFSWIQFSTSVIFVVPCSVGRVRSNASILRTAAFVPHLTQLVSHLASGILKACSCTILMDMRSIERRRQQAPE